MRKAQQWERVTRGQPTGARPQQHRDSQAVRGARDTNTHLGVPLWGFAARGKSGTCSCFPAEQAEHGWCLTPASAELLAETPTGVKHSRQAKRESVFLLQCKVKGELPLSDVGRCIGGA